MWRPVLLGLLAVMSLYMVGTSANENGQSVSRTYMPNYCYCDLDNHLVNVRTALVKGETPPDIPTEDEMTTINSVESSSPSSASDNPDASSSGNSDSSTSGSSDSSSSGNPDSTSGSSDSTSSGSTSSDGNSNSSNGKSSSDSGATSDTASDTTVSSDSSNSDSTNSNSASSDKETTKKTDSDTTTTAPVGGSNAESQSSDESATTTVATGTTKTKDNSREDEATTTKALTTTTAPVEGGTNGDTSGITTTEAPDNTTAADNATTSEGGNGNGLGNGNENKNSQEVTTTATDPNSTTTTDAPQVAKKRRKRSADYTVYDNYYDEDEEEDKDEDDFNVVVSSIEAPYDVYGPVVRAKRETLNMGKPLISQKDPLYSFITRQVEYSGLKTSSDQGVLYDTNGNAQNCSCEDGSIVTVQLCILDLPFENDLGNARTEMHRKVSNELLMPLTISLYRGLIGEGGVKYYRRNAIKGFEKRDDTSTWANMEVVLSTRLYQAEFHVKNAIEPSIRVGEIGPYKTDPEICLNTVDITPPEPVVRSPVWWLRYICLPIAIGVIILLVIFTCIGKRDAYHVGYW